MDSMTSEPGTSKAMLWSGRVLTVLLALVLLFDSGVKIARSPEAVQGRAQLGYPQTHKSSDFPDPADVDSGDDLVDGLPGRRDSHHGAREQPVGAFSGIDRRSGVGGI